MLPPWVVDELEKIRRERLEREREARARIEAPRTPARPENERDAGHAEREEAQRGVVVVDIW